MKINLRICMHSCAQMNRWADTHTHTNEHGFLPTESTSWRCWWRKKRRTKTLNFLSSFQSGCDSDGAFPCGHAKTMSAWVAINLWATFRKNTAAQLPQHVCLTWLTGWILLQTQVMPSAPLPVFELSKHKEKKKRGHRVLWGFLCLQI